MAKKKKKNSLKDVRNLNVQSFLEKYYGITHEGISNMTHKVASSFFPQLKRASFEYIQKNPELVTTGKIVLVEDVQHLMAPYFMPEESFDSSIGCDEREKTIQQIVNTFELIEENKLEGLLFIEGDNPVDRYLYRPMFLHNHFIEYGCLGEMMDATENHTGLFLRKDGTLVGYQLLSHGDNTYDTMKLSSLMRQAVGITKKTDTMGIVYEDGVLSIVMDGMVTKKDQKLDFKKDLLRLFPYSSLPVEKAKYEEKSSLLDAPETYTFTSMPNYELEQLMHVYRASGQLAYYHIVRRELVKRTQSTKTFRKEKLKIKEMKEGEE